jgi:hypothetical protein
LSFLDLCPRILQRNGAVEYWLSGPWIGIVAKISDAFELIPASTAGSVSAGSTFALPTISREPGVQVGGKIRAFLDFIEIRLGEELVVQVHFRIHRVRCRNPMNRGLHLSSVRWIATSAGGIVGAMHLDGSPLSSFTTLVQVTK